MDDPSKKLKENVKNNLEMVVISRGSMTELTTDYNFMVDCSDKNWVMPKKLKNKSERKYKLERKRNIKITHRYDGYIPEKDIELVMAQLGDKFTKEQVIKSFQQNNGDVVDVIMDLQI